MTRGRATGIAVRLLILGLASTGLLGCGPSAADVAKQTKASSQTLVDLLASVQDASSAKAVLGKLGPARKAFADSQVEALSFAIDQLKRAAFGGGDEGGDAIETVLDEARSAIMREEQRLELLDGLPAEFWAEYRMSQVEAQAHFNAAFIEELSDAVGSDGSAMLDGTDSQDPVLAAYQTHGPENVAEVTITGGDYLDQEEAIERLRAMAGAGTTVEYAVDDEDDYDYDEDAESTAMIVAPVTNMQAFCDALDFGEVTSFSPERCAITIEIADDLAGPYAGMSDEEIEQQKLYDAQQAEAERERQEEEERRAAEQLAREQEEERRRAEEEERRRPPEPGADNYFAKLLTNVNDPTAPHHAVSLEQLMEMDPSDAPDDETRQQILAAFYKLTEPGAANRGGFGGNTGGSDAVRGLVRWGGKAVVPRLVELASASTQSIDEAVLEGLAKYPSAEIATLLAGRMKGSQQVEQLAEALGDMGPVAEEPLLGLIPDDNAEVNIAVINALGKCGTKASLRVMRQAARSENEEVASAARDAAEAIRDRAKTTDDKAESPQAPAPADE